MNLDADAMLRSLFAVSILLGLLCQPGHADTSSSPAIDQSPRPSAPTAPLAPDVAPLPANGATPAPPLPSTRADLATYLQSLSDDQRQQLTAKKQLFEQLEASEKDRLRQLHAQIQADPKAKELQNVLQQYSVWLSSLQPKERSMLLDASPAERVERIRELRFREEDTRLTKLDLTNKDTQIIIDWLNQMVTQHESALLESMNPRERQWYDQAPNSEQRRGSLLFRPGRVEFLLKQVTEAQYNLLTDKLSPSALKRLLSTSDKTDERTKLVSEWIDASFWTRFRPPEVSNEKLMKYFEELDAKTREELESLPRDRFYAELRKRYNLQHRGRFERGGPWADGRRGGGRPDRSDEGRPNGRGGKRREFDPNRDRDRDQDRNQRDEQDDRDRNREGEPRGRRNGGPPGEGPPPFGPPPFGDDDPVRS